VKVPCWTVVVQGGWVKPAFRDCLRGLSDGAEGSPDVFGRIAEGDGCV